jgi:NAD(P)H dehydrogenase (quinone)
VIAITGATGAVGARVARLLAEQDHRLRLLVRDAGRAPALGAETSVISDYTDRAGLRSGLHGCDAMLLISARESASRVLEHRTVIEAAEDAGVGKIVYLSFQGAAPDAAFTFARDHWHTEQLIAGTAMASVFLRDCFYQLALAKLAGGDGIIRGPAGSGAVAAVSHDDVAAVAARVLTDARWDGQTLDVTGPAGLTLAQVAAQLATVSGRSVQYVVESEEEAYASRARYAAPEFEVSGWVSSYLAIAAGEVADVSDTVEQVTGRPPQSFADFLRTNPGSWAHLASTARA